MKVLLPVDGSEYTGRILEFLAKPDGLVGRDAHFTAFTVLDPAHLHPARFSNATSMDAFMQDQAERVLGPVRAFMRQRCWTIETDYVPGPTAQAIVGKIEVLKPGLVVMGTHGRSALGSVVLGSVASGVLANCKVPLLLVR